jgi:hypothetical protein
VLSDELHFSLVLSVHSEHRLCTHAPYRAHG